MQNKEMKAEISSQMRKEMKIFLITYELFILFMGILGFLAPIESSKSSFRLYWWFFLPIRSNIPSWGYDHFYAGYLFLAIFIILFLMAIPEIAFLIENRRRKLTELTANEKEIVGSYTAFIPISKLALKMPIDKVDNITVVNSKFYWFTGKMIRIGSTSSVIKIPYVINADEVVAFISEAIEKAKNNKRVQPEEKPEPQRRDAADNLKKIADLRDAGIITEEEFEQKKKELLGKM